MYLLQPLVTKHIGRHLQRHHTAAASDPASQTSSLEHPNEIRPLSEPKLITVLTEADHSPNRRCWLPCASSASRRLDLRADQSLPISTIRKIRHTYGSHSRFLLLSARSFLFSFLYRSIYAHHNCFLFPDTSWWRLANPVFCFFSHNNFTGGCMQAPRCIPVLQQHHAGDLHCLRNPSPIHCMYLVIHSPHIHSSGESGRRSSWAVLKYYSQP